MPQPGEGALEPEQSAYSSASEAISEQSAASLAEDVQRTREEAARPSVASLVTAFNSHAGAPGAPAAATAPAPPRKADAAADSEATSVTSAYVSGALPPSTRSAPESLSSRAGSAGPDDGGHADDAASPLALPALVGAPPSGRPAGGEPPPAASSSARSANGSAPSPSATDPRCTHAGSDASASAAVLQPRPQHARGASAVSFGSLDEEEDGGTPAPPPGGVPPALAAALPALEPPGGGNDAPPEPTAGAAGAAAPPHELGGGVEPTGHGVEEGSPTARAGTPPWDPAPVQGDEGGGQAPPPSGSSGAGEADGVGGAEEGADPEPHAAPTLLGSRGASASSLAPVESEEASWDAWCAQPLHYFVVTSAGKPVYSRRGDEDDLAGFLAIIQAVVSVVEDLGDAPRSMAVGSHRLAFALRGRLVLVAVSAWAEPVAALERRLELLYGQVLLLVTTGVQRMLQNNPGYDVRHLLAGTKPILNALLDGTDTSPAYMLAALQPAPMAPAARRALCDALQDAVRTSGAMYGLVVSGRCVAALERGRAPPLHPLDALLLVNFVGCSEQFRTSEAFTPVCLPHYKAGAFCHMYVHCLHPGEAALHLLLVSGSSDAFHSLSEARRGLQARLACGDAARWLRSGGGGGGGGAVDGDAAAEEAALSVEGLPRAAGGGALGTTPLWHFMVRFPAKRQFLMPSWHPQLAQLVGEAEGVRAYVRLHCTAYAHAHHGPSGSLGASASPHGSLGPPQAPQGPAAASAAATAAAAAVGGGVAQAAASAAAAYLLPPQPPKPMRLLWVTTGAWVCACLPDKEVEMYALMDPLTDKASGLALLQQLRRHIAGLQGDLLIPVQ